ncbi:hypothetical protein [Rhodoferax sp.]|uniref:hypothetical protein n=1 Tax=Rhodoferax sp. TaxID=50421 RepID=UPI002742B2E1|nr:hypothetical protein [Rhodoferax sp.]
MRNLLLLGLMAVITSAAVAAVGQTPMASAPQRPTAGVTAPSQIDAKGTVSDKSQTVALSAINCGFICDSFGRCRRVCW